MFVTVALDHGPSYISKGCHSSFIGTKKVVAIAVGTIPGIAWIFFIAIGTRNYIFFVHINNILRVFLFVQWTCVLVMCIILRIIKAKGLQQ